MPNAIFRAALLLPLFLSWPGPAGAQRPAQVKSPDGHLICTLTLTSPAPTYQVDFDGQPVVRASTLGLAFKGAGPLSAGLRLLGTERRKIDEYYTLPVGKNSRVHNRCQEALFQLQEPGSSSRRLDLRIRAFDDDVAFRYELPAQPNWPSYVLTSENTTFRLAGDPTVLTLFRESHTTSHEGFYSRLPLSSIKADTLMDLPTLFEYPGRAYLAITATGPSRGESARHAAAPHTLARAAAGPQRRHAARIQHPHQPQRADRHQRPELAPAGPEHFPLVEWRRAARR